MRERRQMGLMSLPAVVVCTFTAMGKRELSQLRFVDETNFYAAPYKFMARQATEAGSSGARLSEISD